ncbi:hypothetical protein [Demequina sp. NBRC 110056]|uniref:hypothetical protein n=1 Tax=Demequina sp. NBRC 110056 TaxID=1570345 RepID=UPI0013565A88|nr:hypothetical protein [Demequina sp. NBRC 110056]
MSTDDARRDKTWRLPVVDPRHDGRRTGLGAEGGSWALAEGRPLTKDERNFYLVQALHTASGEPTHHLRGARLTSTVITLASTLRWEVCAGEGLVDYEPETTAAPARKGLLRRAPKPFRPRAADSFKAHDLPLVITSFDGVVMAREPRGVLTYLQGSMPGMSTSVGSGGYGTVADLYEVDDAADALADLAGQVTRHGWIASEPTQRALDAGDVAVDLEGHSMDVTSDGSTWIVTDMSRSAPARGSIAAVAPPGALVWHGGADREGRCIVAVVSTGAPARLTVVTDLIRPRG